MTCPSSPDFFHIPCASSTDWMVGKRKSDEVKMKSMSGIAVTGGFEAGERRLGVPLGGDLDRGLEDVGVIGESVHEALAPLHRVRVREVAHEDQRMQLLARFRELLLGLVGHRLHGLACHRLVVRYDDDALAHVRRRRD